MRLVATVTVTSSDSLAVSTCCHIWPYVFKVYFKCWPPSRKLGRVLLFLGKSGIILAQAPLVLYSFSDLSWAGYILVVAINPLFTCVCSI